MSAVSPNKFQEDCVQILSQIKPQATFLSVRGYRNNFQEVSNFEVVFHASYLNAVKKALAIVSLAKFQLNERFGADDFQVAQQELMDSFRDTLSGYNPRYTAQDVYQPVYNLDQEVIPGIKMHREQNVIHLNALKIRKKVLVPGQYKEVNSQQKTLAKQYLRGLTPLRNWVQFKLEPGRFNQIKVQKMILKGKKQ